MLLTRRRPDARSRCLTFMVLTDSSLGLLRARTLRTFRQQIGENPVCGVGFPSDLISQMVKMCEIDCLAILHKTYFIFIHFLMVNQHLHADQPILTCVQLLCWCSPSKRHPTHIPLFNIPISSPFQNGGQR